MARHPIPQVIDELLTPPDASGVSQPAIAVGSVAWYRWLNDPATRSFAFHGPQGTLTARRERRHGTWYWYAYRTQHGNLHKVYLGKSEELTLARLNDVAARLATESIDSPQESGTTVLSPLPSPASSHRLLDLLTTKLYVPPPRLNMVARPQLMQQMNVAVRGTLTLIVAPAGWGKTTLLSAWHADPSHDTLPLAWVSLDTGDNDPIRFWTYVFSALNTLHPGVAESSLTLLYASSTPPIEAVLMSLLNTLIQLPKETVLVLDDYHLIEAQPIHDAFTYLVEHLPPNMHLVLASRTDPLLPLARLRARGALTELRAANLRFTFEETNTFLTEIMGLSLSPDEVAALEARTEGWITGLHLAALSLQGRDDVAGFIAAFKGSHRYVIDYLVEEVLSRQPGEVQDFLLQTCLLDRLSGPLCNAMCGRDDSQALLWHVERSNLFLVSLDDERLWYRYHQLFAEVLRSRLQQLQPAMVPELHRRASIWFEQHEMFSEAVSHALAIPDFDHAAHLIEQRGMLLAQRGQAYMVLDWLNSLPDALVRTRPYLCIIHALVLMLTRQLEASEARLREAERCVQAGISAELSRTILGWVAAIRATFDIFSGDISRNVALSRQALDLLPETEVIGRAGAIIGAARAFLVSGDVTHATERMISEVAASARASGNLVSILRALTLLARLQMLQGKLHHAMATYEEAVQGVPGQGELRVVVSGPSYSFGLGDLLREWNSLDAAKRHLTQGMELIRGLQVVEAEVATRGYIALARLHQARGESNLALETLDTFVQVAYRCHFVPYLVAQGIAMRAQIELARGNLAAAIHWADTSGLTIKDDLSYPREREYLALVRVRISQGRAHPTGSFLFEALALLKRLLEDAGAKMRISSLLEILLLHALALDAQGNRTESLAALSRALTLAEPEGYIRLFIDEGPPVLALLRQAQARGITPGYVATLVEASGEQIVADSRLHTLRSLALKEPLTQREFEVLQLLLDGASNREIAQQLVLSVNTVKKHVYNICGKLEVQRRAQVIAKARALTLIQKGELL